MRVVDRPTSIPAVGRSRLAAETKPAAPKAMVGEGAAFSGFGDPHLMEFIRGGLGAMTEAGVSITPKLAMRNTTVLRCVSLISFAIGMLPLQLHRREDKSKATEHPLYRVLHRRPNAWQTSYEFRAFMQQSALGAVGDGRKGDAFALIVRSGRKILQLVPLDPSTVEVRQRNDWSLEYVVTRKDRQKQTFPQADIFHLRFGLSDDGISGLSLVKQAAEAIALAIQTEKAAARLFRNGMLVGGMLKHPAELTPESYARLQASMADREGAENAHRTLILEEGMTFDTASATGRDSQAIEQRKFQIEDIARPFGVPRPLLNVDDTSWGSGIDVLGQFFVRYGLNPWFEAWQQAIERSLLTEPEADVYEAKFNAGGLLRGSMKDQADFFAKGLGAGGHAPWLHPDEPRDWMDLPPRTDLPAAMGQTNNGDRNEPS
ncbi:HK97 family phage portal protein [Palleronia aestuarii]|uniref:HK97 family phage portal protein n=2 Tax=Palleronia aestuarii TaxID=568105 RepID=A0A2W7NIW3_9RHOB|nr:HK97 family phage portal protein [Palleronia aestuarii]